MGTAMGAMAMVDLAVAIMVVVAIDMAAAADFAVEGIGHIESTEKFQSH